MKIEVNGIALHVQDTGARESNAPALVFLHYYGGSSRTWADVIDSLGARYRCVAIDHRGWGESDKPSSGYSLAGLANDAQQVIGKLGLQRFVIVGHSMGGKVAQLIASRRPQGLAGLVLVAPSPPTPLAMPPEALVGMQGVYASRESIEGAVDHMLTARPLSAARREQVIEDSLRGGAEAKVAWPRDMSQEDISREVSKIDVPTLVIAGELDRVDNPATLRTELLTRIPQANMHVIPGTGHLSPLESPVNVARLIESFMRDVG